MAGSPASYLQLNHSAGQINFIVNHQNILRLDLIELSCLPDALS